MTLSTTPVRDVAERDAEISHWLDAILDSADAIDVETVEQIAATANRWATRVSATPPPSLSVAALAEIRRIIIEGINRHQELLAKPVDALEDLVLRAEAIRHVFRDAMDADVGTDPSDARALLVQLDEWLPRVNQTELAHLVGRSQRQILRWRREGGSATERLYTVARIVALLRHGWTPEGIVAWFDRRLPALAARPIDLLEDAEARQDLIEAARRGRSQPGS